MTAAPGALRSALGHADPPVETATPARPRLIFAVDATASREPAWAAARQVTDALVKALPGALDVALAVHGGSRVHTFTAFTSDANMLRDRAAGVACAAGLTRLLPILSASLKQPGVRVVIYIGNVFEESMPQGRRLADAMGKQGTRLIVLHDTADPAARQDAEVFRGSRKTHRRLCVAVQRQCFWSAARAFVGRRRLRCGRGEAPAGAASRSAWRGRVARPSQQAKLSGESSACDQTPVRR